MWPSIGWEADLSAGALFVQILLLFKKARGRVRETLAWIPGSSGVPAHQAVEGRAIPVLIRTLLPASGAQKSHMYLATDGACACLSKSSV